MIEAIKKIIRRDDIQANPLLDAMNDIAKAATDAPMDIMVEQAFWNAHEDGLAALKKSLCMTRSAAQVARAIDAWGDHFKALIAPFDVAKALIAGVKTGTRDEAERRAANRRAQLKNRHDPEPDDEEDEPDTKKGTSMTPTTRQDAYAAMDDIVKRARQPNETHAKAYARLMREDPMLKQMYAASKGLPDTVIAPAPVIKHEPTDAGYLALRAKAAELRKADPKLTKEQAFAKAYQDPANRGLVAIHKRVN